MKRLIFLALWAQYLVASNNWPHVNVRDMIILLDWNNEIIERDLPDEDGNDDSFGPVTDDLCAALEQKAAPILVTQPTFRNFYVRKNFVNDCLAASYANVYTEYKKKGLMSNEEKGKNFYEVIKNFTFSAQFHQKIQNNVKYRRYIVAYLVPFKKDEWYVTTFANGYFYLLIPKKYLQDSASIYPPEEITKRLAIGKNSLNAISLGLKIAQTNELEKLGDEYLLKKSLRRLDAGKDFLKILPDLFFTYQDLKNMSKEKTEKTIEENIAFFLPQWSIYLSGHGSEDRANLASLMAGLKVDEFASLLQFFNNKIATNFLYYITCFIGGKHLVDPFEQQIVYPPLQPKGYVRKTIAVVDYKYTIAAASFLYAKTIQFMPRINFRNYSLVYSQQFLPYFAGVRNYFYPQLKPKAKIMLKDILKDIMPIGKIKEGEFQYPVVRFPGTAWFSVPELPEKVFRITRTLAQTREAEGREIVIANKDLLIIDVQYFWGRKKTVDRYHTEILTPVIIENAKDLPVVFSTAPGPADFYFEKMIIKKDKTFSQVLKAFLQGTEQHGRRYYIKEMHCKNDFAVGSKAAMGARNIELQLNNVIIIENDTNPITNEKNQSGVLFQFKEQSYQILFDAKQISALGAQPLKGQTKLERKIPAYPHEIDKDRLKKVAQAAKKHAEEIKKKKEGTQPTSQQPTQPVALEEIAKDLNQLNTTLESLLGNFR